MAKAMFPGEKAFLSTNEGNGCLVWVAKPSSRTVLIQDNRNVVQHYFCPLPYLVYSLNFTYSGNFSEKTKCKFRSIGVAASPVDIECWEDCVGSLPYSGFTYPKMCLGEIASALTDNPLPLRRLRDKVVDAVWSTTSGGYVLGYPVTINGNSYSRIEELSRDFVDLKKPAIDWKIPQVTYTREVTSFFVDNFRNVGESPDFVKKLHPKFIADPSKEKLPHIAYVYQHVDAVFLAVVKPSEVRTWCGHNIEMPSLAFVMQATRKGQGYIFEKVLVNGSPEPIHSWDQPTLGKLPFFAYEDIYFNRDLNRDFSSLEEMNNYIQEAVYQKMESGFTIENPVIARTAENRIKVIDHLTLNFVMGKFPDAEIEMPIKPEQSFRELVINAIKNSGYRENRPIYLAFYDRQSIGETLIDG